MFCYINLVFITLHDLFSLKVMTKKLMLKRLTLEWSTKISTVMLKSEQTPSDLSSDKFQNTISL